MASLEGRSTVYKIVYPAGSFAADTVDRQMFMPVDGDGWTLEDANQIISALAESSGRDEDGFGTVETYGEVGAIQ